MQKTWHNNIPQKGCLFTAVELNKAKRCCLTSSGTYISSGPYSFSTFGASINAHKNIETTDFEVSNNF